MIDQEFKEIIDQEFGRVKSKEGSILLAKYNNEFSVKSLKVPENEDVRLFSYDLSYRDIMIGIEPFLDIIKTVVEEKFDNDLEAFMEKAGIYTLHRDLYRTYYATGEASRNEKLIFAEHEYERKRFKEELAAAIIMAAKEMPFLLVINRAQIGTYGLLEELDILERTMDKASFGIILGFSNSIPTPYYTAHFWEEFCEGLDDFGRIVNIGNAEKTPGTTENIPPVSDFGRDQMVRISNLLSFFDNITADYYLSVMYKRVEDKISKIPDEDFIYFTKLRARNYLLQYDTAKTLECLNEIKDRAMGMDKDLILGYLYLSAEAYMYNEAFSSAEEIVDACFLDYETDDEWRYEFEVLRATIKMGAWRNIFFCREEVGVSDELLKKMEERGQYNHLAFFHIFAFNNDLGKMREQVENEPEHFKKGLEIAKKLDNKLLIHLAYEKNIMMASTYGLNDVAIAYFSKEVNTLSEEDYNGQGRIHSGIGYNLSALGHNKDADAYYDIALSEYYRSQKTVDLAEVLYNKSLNKIATGDYYMAENILNMVLKIIRHLRLNRIRVCNISKIYGLMALTSIMQGNGFSCEQHLKRCSNFLSYYMNKDYQDIIDLRHDYTNYDDEILLYYLSSAILNDRLGNRLAAEKYYTLTENYLHLAKGNGYFCEKIYYENRKRFEKYYGNEATRSRVEKAYQAYKKEYESRQRIDLSNWVQPNDVWPVGESITKEQIDGLIERDEYKNSDANIKRLKIFIEEWQDIINTENINPSELLETAMWRFKTFFSVDHCLYLRLKPDGSYEQIYNDTGAHISALMTVNIGKYLMVNQRGLVISKISNEYEDYSELLDIFGGEKICSFVMIPFISDGKIEHVFITYIEMRDSWFSRLNHFLLDYQDMDAYRLLFHEIVNAIQRIEGVWKVREMNRELYQAAVTDQLTHIRNRNGLYSFIEELNGGNWETFRGHSAVMFIDLDNFKAYNDYYGHEAGDYVLEQFAHMVEKVVSRQGVVTRYGGDEFIILLSTDDKNVVSDIAEEILLKIKEEDGYKTHFKSADRKNEGEEPKNISCSIGIATSPRDGSPMDVSGLIRRADKALYKVKNSGKGTYFFL